MASVPPTNGSASERGRYCTVVLAHPKWIILPMAGDDVEVTFHNSRPSRKSDFIIEMELTTKYTLASTMIQVCEWGQIRNALPLGKRESHPSRDAAPVPVTARLTSVTGPAAEPQAVSTFSYQDTAPFTISWSAMEVGPERPGGGGREEEEEEDQSVIGVAAGSP